MAGQSAGYETILFIPIEILYLAAAAIAGLLAGGLVVWIVGRHRFAVLRAQREAGEAQLAEKEVEIRDLNRRLSDAAAREVHLTANVESLQASMKSQADMFEEIRSRAEQAFSSLSSKALQDNNRYFLDLAKTTFARYFEAAKSEMANKSQNIDAMVQPIVESLEKYDRQVQAMEQARQEAYGGLTQQVISLAKTQQDLQQETGKLVSALRLPHVRGRWGEMTLKRVVEIAGMQAHCDFFEQPTSSSENGVMRPDMLVRLPGNRSIVIDAKVPITAYLIPSTQTPTRKRKSTSPVMPLMSSAISVNWPRNPISADFRRPRNSWSCSCRGKIFSARP